MALMAVVTFIALRGLIGIVALLCKVNKAVL